MKALIGLALLLASPAVAQRAKPLCPDRGAIQPCVVGEGVVQVEVALADWFADSDHTLAVGDSVVRLGLSDTLEIQAGVAPWTRKGEFQGHGDLRLAVRQNLLQDRISLGIQPQILLPTGSRGLTQGRIGASVALGGTLDISHETQLYWSPTLWVLPRVGIGGALGVNQTIWGPLGGSLEVFAQTIGDQDQASLDASLTLTLTDDLEVDLGTNLGVTRDTPDAEVFLGVTLRL